MRERHNLRGRYRIELRDAQTNALVKAWMIDNQLTTISQTVRSQMLAGTYTGTVDDLEIKYFAFGTGTNPATPSDTALQAESFRKQVTQITVVDDGTVSSVLSLGSSEGNGITIREIGVFVGPNATATANSGTLLSRVIVNIEKNSNMILNVVRTDYCTI